VLVIHLFSLVGARVLDGHGLICNSVAKIRFLNLDSRFAKGGSCIAKKGCLFGIQLLRCTLSLSFDYFVQNMCLQVCSLNLECSHDTHLIDY
jgi:hypothetical protein